MCCNIVDLIFRLMRQHFDERKHNDVDTVLKNNLKLLRKERHLTQIALQTKTGIEQALLSKYENGERIPPTTTLMNLADFYNVSMDYIMCRTDVPEINTKRNA